MTALISSCAVAPANRQASVIMHDGVRHDAMAILAALDKNLDLKILDFVVEESSIQDVLDKLGEAKIVKAGQTASSNTSVCYIVSENEGVRFNSGEMSNGKYIISIEVFNTDFVDTQVCAAARVKNEVRGLENLRGIKLGLTKPQMLKILGEPSLKRTKDHWHYYYSSKKSTKKCEGGFDVSGAYTLIFNKDRLVHFFVSQITSC